MKPYKLVFSGLHSYRDEQLIDFLALGYAGIFGVFGPTGGGKSTILDAVTLALFGRVERAKNGTRGIMNQFENKLAVSFEFGLGEERFLVERLYQRDKNDPDSVKVKNARLLKISDEVQVLADKANEVDNRIVGLLGTSFEDFSRAVILPQGKFDQFLKLTGGDRARMLENILRLERYGEVLWKKASRLEASLAQDIITNQKLMEQLGDASEEAVSDAGQKLSCHRNWLTEKEKEVKAAEHFYEELVRQVKVSEEIKNLNIKKELLDSQKDFFAGEKERFTKAQKAEPLRGMALQAEKLALREHEETETLLAGDNQLSKARVRLQEAALKLEEAKSAASGLNEIREITLPKAALAVSYQQRLEEIDREVKKAETTLTLKRNALNEIIAGGQEKNRLLEGLLREKEELLKQRSSMQGLFLCRPIIEKAFTAQAGYENAQGQADEAAANALRIEKLFREESLNFRRLLMENLALPGTDLTMTELSVMVEKAAKLLAQAEQKYTLADEAREEAMVKNMAAALSEKLTAGEPCPVCGATDHSSPAVDSPEGQKGISTARAQASSAKVEMERLRQWDTNIRLASNSLENLRQELDNQYQPLVKTKNLAFTEADKIMQEAVADLKAALSSVGLEDALPPDSPLNELRAILQEADEGQQLLTERLNELEQNAGRLTTTIGVLREEYSVLKTEINGLEETRSQRLTEMSQIRKQMDEFTGGQDPVDFSQNLKGQISAIEQAHEQAKRDWEQINEEYQSIAQNQAVLTVGLARTREQLSAVQSDFARHLSEAGFSDSAEMRKALLDDDARQAVSTALDEYRKSAEQINDRIQALTPEAPPNGIGPEEMAAAQQSLEKHQKELRDGVREEGVLTGRLTDLKEKQEQWVNLCEERAQLVKKKELTSRLVGLCKGRRFVQFLAEEHLQDMAREASVRLSQLTGFRYGLELDSGFNFVLRDDFSGGQRRPVNSLSGGETFLTSLALALALSSKIQLNGRYPLGFFFLDEGFGTLDPEKLEVVMQTLERLHDGARIVGVITHVPELRNRIPRYLEIIPARQDGKGSQVIIGQN